MAVEPINVKISKYYQTGDLDAIHDVEAHFEERGMSKNYMLLFAFDAQIQNITDGKSIDDNIYSLIDVDHLDHSFMGRIMTKYPEMNEEFVAHPHAFKVVAAYQVWHEMNIGNIAQNTAISIKEKIKDEYGFDIPLEIVEKEFNERAKGQEQVRQ